LDAVKNYDRNMLLPLHEAILSLSPKEDILIY
jgi:hypothetical protein